MKKEPMWRRYLRLNGPNVRADVDDEFEFHIQTRADELIRQGWSADAARRRAVEIMGDVNAAKRECMKIDEKDHRKKRRWDRLDIVGQDLHYGARALVRSPAFTAIVVVTLALSIGATTAIFSIVDGVLLKPLRVAEPERLFAIFEVNTERVIAQQQPSGPNFLDWKRTARSFSGMAAYRPEGLTLTGVGPSEMLPGAGVSANLFDVLGVRPLIGRTFLPGEDEGGGARIVVLSYGAWQRLFAGARDVVGRVMLVDRVPYEVVGVMPPSFSYPNKVAVWRPADLSSSPPSAGLLDRLKESRQARYIGVIARLKPGATQRGAEQEMERIAADLARIYPLDDGGWTTKLIPLRDTVVRNVEDVLLLVLAAVAFVLLIACANVANLTLGRAIARQTEMAVRVALGAGQGRLYRQMLTESLLLAVIGGLLGVGLAWAGVRMFVSVASTILPRLDEVAIDARALAFAVGVTIVTGILFGLAPSVRVARTSVAGALRLGRSGGGGQRSGRVRRMLVIGEVALAVLVLVGAGLTLRSVARLLAINPGYTTEHVIAARVSLDGKTYQGNRAKATYLSAITERIAALPGVRRVGVTTTFPLTPAGIDFQLGYHAEGQPDLGPVKAPRLDYRMISPGYLEAMDIRLVSGRAFNSFDRIDSDSQPSAGANPEGHKVMIVNEAFARLNWPGQSAIGKHVRLDYVRSDPWEVVGVVRDTRHANLTSVPRPQVFVPVAQAELLFGYMTIVVRTNADGPDVVPGMRAVAGALDPSEPLYDIDTIEALRATATARDRMTAVVFGAFALLAVVLAGAGIYGVIAYQVARRTREIGVRIALGASRARVVHEVVSEAARLALLGIALGAAGALAGTRFVRSLLFGVAPTDPITFGAVAILLLGVAVAAALVPAARAASIQPVEALRSE